ncbi:MAG: regulatory protein RecX [bacterium]|nr:regulatory protein RecX [bacterium]
MKKSTAREIAIDILSRRDNSIHEMRIKLKRKKVSQEDIEETIRWLESKKLLDDRAFAQKRVESIFRTKLVGPKFIQSKLREAKIAGEICDEVLESLASEEEWKARAQKALETWQKIHIKHKDDKIRKMRFLASRGF